MTSCLVSGLPSDPLIDVEVWKYDLVLGAPAQGASPAVPFDLTGSSLAITFRTLIGFIPVSTLSTDTTRSDLDGTIVITDAIFGKVSITSDPWKRTYRVSTTTFGLPLVSTIRGDVMRLIESDPDARPEYLGYIQFPLRAGTTPWPAPVIS